MVFALSPISRPLLGASLSSMVTELTKAAYYELSALFKKCQALLSILPWPAVTMGAAPHEKLLRLEGTCLTCTCGCEWTLVR